MEAIMKNILNNVTRHIALRRMADFFEKVERNPVTRTPKEVGLDYEDMSFKSLDGVNLKGWYIPSENGDKLVIFNHFMLGNRAGAVPQEDWGNVTVDFMPLYKHLVDAGYSVFTYDLRNHGESDVFNNGRLGLTNTEYQDVVASVRYAKARFPGKDLYLYSQCYGTVSTIRAMDKNPEDFEGIEAFVNIQPLTPEGFVTGVTTKFNMAHEDNLQIFGNRLKRKTGYGLEDCKVPAEAVKMPTLTVQVHDVWRTTPESIEEIYANLGTSDKKLLWIENEDERLEGYNYFARNPQELIEWYDTHS
jgi:pimeloyl-ACP methyl ester carboxylesterase